MGGVDIGGGPAGGDRASCIGSRHLAIPTPARPSLTNFLTYGFGSRRVIASPQSSRPSLNWSLDNAACIVSANVVVTRCVH